MWLTILLTILAAIPILGYLIHKYLRRNDEYWPKLGVYLLDQSEANPLFNRLTFREPFINMEQNLYTTIRNKHNINTYAGIMEFGAPTLVVLDLDIIKQILVKDFDHFVDRRTFDMSKSDPYFNEMLVSLSGQKWKNVRATLSPTFTTGRIRRMFDVFHECGEKMTTFLSQELTKPDYIRNNGLTDCRDLCSRFTMDVIANAAFGIDSKMFQDSNGNSEFARLGKILQNSNNTTVGRLKLLLFIMAPKLLNIFRIPVLNSEAMDYFTKVVKSSVEYREKTGTKRDDFLQLLIETQKGELKPEDSNISSAVSAAGAGNKNVGDDDSLNQELQKGTKIQLTDISLIAQTILFFFAGFDTTETLLIFCMYALATNPEMQEKLHEEIDEAVKNSKDGKLTYDILMNLQYLDMIISETLRKYPAGIRLERKCTKDYTIPGTNLTIKKDQVVIVPVLGIHHDETYFPDPEKFDPERFTPENKATRHPYAYMPFGQGPRSCIAMRFALVEGKAAIAHLIHKFKLEPSAKTPIPLVYEKVAIKPAGGLWLNITERK